MGLYKTLNVDLKELSDIGTDGKGLQGSSMLERDFALIHGIFGIEPDDLSPDDLLKYKRRAWVYLFASGKASIENETIKGVKRDVLKMHG